MTLKPSAPIVNVVKANAANIFLKTVVGDKAIVPTYINKNQELQDFIPNLEYLFNLANDKFKLGDSLGIVSGVTYFINDLQETINVMRENSYDLVNLALRNIENIGIDINQKEYCFYFFEYPTDTNPHIGVHFIKSMFLENEQGNDGLSDIGYIFNNLKNYSEQIFINTLELDSNGAIQMGKI